MGGPVSSTHTPWDAAWHLRAELGRLLDTLARHLAAQRDRGRTPSGDVVRGLVIEDGEAEGLIAALAADCVDSAPADGSAPAMRLDAEIAERARLGHAQGAFLPLQHARAAFDLAPAEYYALLLALAVDVDARFGRLVAYLNDHVSRTRPTIGLALALAGADAGRPGSAIGLLERPCLRDGLLDADGDAPLPGLALKVPAGFAPRLTGQTDRPAHDWLSVHAPDAALLDRLVLDDATGRHAAIWSDALRARRLSAPLVIAGAEGGGRATLARALLFRAGLAVVQADVIAEDVAARLRIVRREARWHAAAVVVRAAAAAQQPIEWTAVWSALDCTRPTIVVVGPDQVDRAVAAAPIDPAVLRLDDPDAPLRARLWRVLVPHGDRLPESEVAELAARFPFGPGRIAQSARRAAADLGAPARGRAPPRLRRAARGRARRRFRAHRPARAEDGAALRPRGF